MNKTELKEILKKEYGYKDKDFIDEDGKELLKSELENILEKEEANNKVSQLNETDETEEDVIETEEETEFKDDSLSFFDRGVNESEHKKIKDSDLITVMSGLDGAYVHTSRLNGNKYSFNYFGQTEEIPYKEIVNIRNQTPNVINNGWLIILNVDVIKSFGLEGKYKNIFTPNNIDTIFNKSPQDILSMVKQLPTALKETLASIAKKRYTSGQLDRISVIEAIEEGTGIYIKED